MGAEVIAGKPRSLQAVPEGTALHTPRGRADPPGQNPLAEKP